MLWLSAPRSPSLQTFRCAESGRAILRSRLSIACSSGQAKKSTAEASDAEKGELVSFHSSSAHTESCLQSWHALRRESPISENSRLKNQSRALAQSLPIYAPMLEVVLWCCCCRGCCCCCCFCCCCCRSSSSCGSSSGSVTLALAAVVLVVVAAGVVVPVVGGGGGGGDGLLGVDCLLLVVGCWLLVVGCWLSVVGWR